MGLFFFNEPILDSDYCSFVIGADASSFFDATSRIIESNLFLLILCVKMMHFSVLVVYDFGEMYDPVLYLLLLANLSTDEAPKAGILARRAKVQIGLDYGRFPVHTKAVSTIFLRSLFSGGAGQLRFSLSILRSRI